MQREGDLGGRVATIGSDELQQEWEEGKMGVEGALCHCGSPASYPVDVCSGGTLEPGTR